MKEVQKVELLLEVDDRIKTVAALKKILGKVNGIKVYRVRNLGKEILEDPTPMPKGEVNGEPYRGRRPTFLELEAEKRG